MIMKESTLFPGFFIREDTPEERGNTGAAFKYDGEPIRVSMPPYSMDSDGIMACLANSLSKDRLVRLLQPIVTMLVSRKLLFVDNGEELSVAEVEKYCGFSIRRLYYNKKKESLLLLLHPLVYDAAGFMRFAASFGQEVRDLWQSALDEYMVSPSELGTWAPVNIRENRYLYWGRQSVRKREERPSPLLLLECVGTGYEDACYRVPQPLAAHQIKTLYADSLNPKGLDTLPEKFISFSGADLRAAYRNLALFAESGQIKFTAKGTVTVSSLKSARKALNLSELPAPGASRTASMWRLELLLTFFDDVYVKTDHDDGGMYRRLVSNLAPIMSNHPLVLLPGIVALKPELSFSPLISLVSDIVAGTLRQLSDGKWYDARAIELRMRIKEVKGELGAFAIEKWGISYRTVYGTCSNADIYSDVSVPMARGMLAALASFGIVDVGIEDGESLYDKDSQMYVRVTDTGRYALGLAETLPDTGEGETGSLFAADGQTRTVRSLTERNPMLPILENVAVRGQDGVYRVSAVSFLRKCSDGGALESAIADFRRYILGGNDEEWKPFFSELRSRVERVHRSYTDYFTILDVDPSAGEVIEFLSTDAEVRANTLRAEGCRLVVPERYMPRLLQLLRGIGYVPER